MILSSSAKLSPAPRFQCLLLPPPLRLNEIIKLALVLVHLATVSVAAVAQTEIRVLLLQTHPLLLPRLEVDHALGVLAHVLHLARHLD